MTAIVRLIEAILVKVPVVISVIGYDNGHFFNMALFPAYLFLLGSLSILDIRIDNYF